MIQEPGKPVRVEHDSQTAGLFEAAGLTPVAAGIPDPREGERCVFTARKQASG
jgi:hypothetical protein